MKRYFVAYSYPSGFGSVQMEMEFPIEKMEHIVYIQDYLTKKQNMGTIIVLYYQELKNAQQSVQLTALRRGLNLSFSVNIFLAVLLVLALIGGN